MQKRLTCRTSTAWPTRSSRRKSPKVAGCARSCSSCGSARGWTGASSPIGWRQTFRKESGSARTSAGSSARRSMAWCATCAAIDLALERGRKVKKPPRDLERLLALLVLERLLEPARAATRRAATSTGTRSRQSMTRSRASASRRSGSRSPRRCPTGSPRGSSPTGATRRKALALALNERAPMTVRANRSSATRDALAAELAREDLQTAARASGAIPRSSSTSRTNLFALGGVQARRDGGAGRGQPAARRARASRRPQAARRRLLRRRRRQDARDRGAARQPRPHDRDRHRCAASSRSCAAARAARGVSNAQAMHSTAALAAELDALRGKADVVFVDAPCSGIGALAPQSRGALAAARGRHRRRSRRRRRRSWRARSSSRHRARASSMRPARC